jgi:translation initiation factor IF-3
MKYYRLNNRITAPKIRLIDETGRYLGIFDTAQAIIMAQEKGLDLVEIDPKAEPPVAKIIDFGQFKYQLAKKAKKEKTKKTELKTIRLSLRTGRHDLLLKAEQTKKFLNDGHSVKIELNLKGREKMHTDLAENVINNLLASIENLYRIEKPLNKQGGKLTLTIKKT